jgi:hypothetical protein
MRKRFLIYKFILCISLLYHPYSAADTIWCTALKVGCLSIEEKNKKFESEQQRCRNLANNSYREGLQEAIADSTVWQFAGKESAQDYARMRGDLMLNICMKRVLKN